MSKNNKCILVINQNDNNCHRCTMQYTLSDEEKADCIKRIGYEDFDKWYCDFNKVKQGIMQCDTCRKLFCNRCYKIHHKYNECFIYNKQECVYCGGPGWYDYGVKKVLCAAHI